MLVNSDPHCFKPHNPLLKTHNKYQLKITWTYVVKKKKKKLNNNPVMTTPCTGEIINCAQCVNTDQVQKKEHDK